jgi:GntR family transcriptional regulator/MocR family aminotransferase
LITVGAQHGLYLIAQLLLDSNTIFGIENPGYVDMRNVARLTSATVNPLPVSHQGLVLNDAVNECDYVYVTPSHQFPTTVTMPIEHRVELLARATEFDFVIIEDDYESQLEFSGYPAPALKSLDSSDRVLYVGSLSKTLAPGLRIGYLVGPAKLVKELRALRRLMLRHPPANNQRATALFLERGHHDSLLKNLRRAYKERLQTLVIALREYLPEAVHSLALGGSSLWIKGPENLDARKLREYALQAGVLVDSGDVYFLGSERPLNYFRLGFSSIPNGHIRPGVAKLARVINDMGGSRSLGQ